MHAAIVICEIENTGTDHWVYVDESPAKAMTLGLENACNLILYWMNPQAGSGIRELPDHDEVEEINSLIAGKKYEAAIEAWRDFQNRSGEPEAEVMVIDASVNCPISRT